MPRIVDILTFISMINFMLISAAHISKMLKNKDLAFKCSDVVIIMLENVDVQIIVGILTFYEHDEFHAQMS